MNMINTTGWTPCHAASAEGQNKALRLLGGNLSIADKRVISPFHQAAKNAHVHALKVLQDLGAIFPVVIIVVSAWVPTRHSVSLAVVVTTTIV